MKKPAMMILVMIVLCSSVFPQEEPIPPRRGRAAKVGAFGGFTPGWLFLDVKPLNSFLVGSGGAGLRNNGVFLYGGAGAAYVMFIPNLRIGGLGMSGSLESTSLDAFGLRRDAELTAGFGGVTFDYVIPVVERLDVSVGIMLGGGGIDIRLQQDNGRNKTWGQEWSDFTTGSYRTGSQVNNIQRELSGSFYVWVPSLNVEYAVLGWLGARIGLSYVGMSNPSWTLDGSDDLLGVPDNVNGDGVMINAGLFVGTF